MEYIDHQPRVKRNVLIALIDKRDVFVLPSPGLPPTVWRIALARRAFSCDSHRQIPRPKTRVHLTVGHFFSLRRFGIRVDHNSVTHSRMGHEETGCWMSWS